MAGIIIWQFYFTDLVIPNSKGEGLSYLFFVKHDFRKGYIGELVMGYKAKSLLTDEIFDVVKCVALFRIRKDLYSTVPEIQNDLVRLHKILLHGNHFGGLSLVEILRVDERDKSLDFRAYSSSLYFELKEMFE